MPPLSAYLCERGKRVLLKENVAPKVPCCTLGFNHREVFRAELTLKQSVDTGECKVQTFFGGVIMTRKVLIISLLFLIAISGLFLPTANSATPITEFDGTYIGEFTLTVTVTVADATDTLKDRSHTVTNAMSLTVRKGAILGWGKGFILNKAGKATITLSIPEYGNMTVNANFSRNTSTGVTTVTGIMSGSFLSASTVINGSFSANGGDKFSFTIPSALRNAQIGKKFPGYSFCQPPVASGGLCGSFQESTSPSGGKAPYTFRLKIGSDFLPTGIILNSRTGQISGTPKAGQKPGTKELTVCAYDSNEAFTGVCRTTKMVLTR